MNKTLAAIARTTLAISETGAECGKLLEFQSLSETRQATIRKLERDLSAIHGNRDDAEQRSRASRLTTVSALLSIERSDLATLNSEIETQADRVIESHRRTIDLLQQVWSCLVAARKTNVQKTLTEKFDLRLLPPVEMIANAAHSVIEINEMQHVLFAHRGRNERDGIVSDALMLHERSEALLEAARNEPDLTINLVLAPDVTPTVARPKLAVSGNVSGTLAQPQFA